jgi:hypothetical protein
LPLKKKEKRMKSQLNPPTIYTISVTSMYNFIQHERELSWIVYAASTNNAFVCREYNKLMSIKSSWHILQCHESPKLWLTVYKTSKFLLSFASCSSFNTNLSSLSAQTMILCVETTHAVLLTNAEWIQMRFGYIGKLGLVTEG